MNANETNQTTSLGSMNKAELQGQCEARELVQTGTKAQMRARIERFDGNQTTAPAPVKTTAPAKKQRNKRILSKEAFKALKQHNGGPIPSGMTLKQAVDAGYLNADGSLGTAGKGAAPVAAAPVAAPAEVNVDAIVAAVIAALGN